ncbi:hypothetical protein R1flu_010159 [Riccia fluitans]|uniref:Fucosyltransferase n=1 Tax=Riccia fluitans TaxID=41844 RepID=A0ABD1Z8E3_9MARC
MMASNHTPPMAKQSVAKRVKASLTTTTRTPTIGKVLPLFCLGLFLLPLFIQSSDSVNRFLRARFPSFPSEEELTLENDTSSAPKSQAPPVDPGSIKLPKPVKELVEAIREATRQAWGGDPVPYSDEEKKKWEETNPCRARVELKTLYSQRKHMRDVPDNEQWNLVFEEYGKLHRACTTRVGDLEKYFKSENSSIPACKFVVAETHFGLGNKIYHLSSVFMFAVVTQRIMLIPETTSVPAVVCEPFPGSSWKMKPRFYEQVKKARKTSLQFYDDVDLDMNKTSPLETYASAISNVWKPEPRFWCDTEQNYLTRITWLTIDGCLLWAHKLWAIDMFRPALEALFPDRIVFTRILRSLMLPTNPVWERVLHVNEVYLRNANKQVGIQVRFLNGEKEYTAKNELINDRVTRCVWENKLLPEVCPSKKDPNFNDPKYAKCAEKLTAEDHKHPNITKVLIASLFLGLHDHLNDIYLRHEATTTKESVGLIQLTHEKIQGSGVEVDSQALVEMISLSMSDVLIVTPSSTFGGVAQAYGGLIPWFIEYAKKKGEPDQCEKGLGIEPCFLGANIHYSCKYDPPGYQDVPDLYPYFKSCLFIDVGDGYGMQMVPDKREDHDFSIH